MPVQQTTKLSCAIFNFRNLLRLVGVLLFAFLIWKVVNDFVDDIVVPITSWMTGNTNLNNRCFILSWAPNHFGIGISPSIHLNNVGGWSSSNSVPCHSIAAQGGLVVMYGSQMTNVILFSAFVLVYKLLKYLYEHGPLGTGCISTTAFEMANEGCPTQGVLNNNRGLRRGQMDVQDVQDGYAGSL